MRSNMTNAQIADRLRFLVDLDVTTECFNHLPSDRAIMRLAAKRLTEATPKPRITIRVPDHDDA